MTLARLLVGEPSSMVPRLCAPWETLLPCLRDQASAPSLQVCRPEQCAGTKRVYTSYRTLAQSGELSK